MRRSSCENVLGLPGNHASTKSTILPVYYLTTMPLPLSTFTTAIPSGPPHAHRRGGAGTGRLRRPHQTLIALSKEPMLTSTSTRSGGRRYDEWGRCPELPPRRRTSLCDVGRVPVNQGTDIVNKLKDGQ